MLGSWSERGPGSSQPLVNSPGSQLVEKLKAVKSVAGVSRPKETVVGRMAASCFLVFFVLFCFLILSVLEIASRAFIQGYIPNPCSVFWDRVLLSCPSWTCHLPGIIGNVVVRDCEENSQNQDMEFIILFYDHHPELTEETAGNLSTTSKT